MWSLPTEMTSETIFELLSDFLDRAVSEGNSAESAKIFALYWSLRQNQLLDGN